MEDVTPERHGARALPARSVLTDEVYGAVLSLLMDRVVAPGQRVGIEELARMLQVSPTPVREALVRLEAEGLVAKQPLRGYTAAELLDAEGLRQLYEMRELLEPAAARLAASRASTTVLDQLAESVERMRREQSRVAEVDASYGQFKDFADHDSDFHRIIAATSGNRLVSEALIRLRPHLHLYRLQFPDGVAADTVEEHARVLDAVQAGDGAAAEAAMRAHIAASYERMSALAQERDRP